MTAQRTPGDKPPGSTPSGDSGAKPTTVSEAKGSVHEAIGKLIGDDAARARGTAQKNAAADDAADIKKSPPRQ